MVLSAGCNTFKPYEPGSVRVASFDYQPQVMVQENLKVDEAVGLSFMSLEEGSFGAAYSFRFTNDAEHRNEWLGEAHRTGMYEQYYDSMGLGVTYGFVVNEDVGFGAFVVYEQKSISTYAEMTYLNSAAKDFLTDFSESKQEGINLGLIGWRGGVGYSIAYDDYLGSFIFGLVL